MSTLAEYPIARCLKWNPRSSYTTLYKLHLVLNIKHDPYFPSGENEEWSASESAKKYIMNMTIIMEFNLHCFKYQLIACLKWVAILLWFLPVNQTNKFFERLVLFIKAYSNCQPGTFRVVGCWETTWSINLLVILIWQEDHSMEMFMLTSRQYMF